MQQVNQSNSVPIVSDARLDIKRISALAHPEAQAIAKMELARFIAVAECIEGDEWEQPTACSLWDVRQLVAHQASQCAIGAAGFKGFLQASSPGVLRPYQQKGMAMLDAMNQFMVDQRSQHSPAQLIAEIREAGPRAIEWRHRLPWLLRALKLPMPVIGIASLGYLMDIIYTRDMWMHRADICRATGHEFTLSAEHDGRIVALIMRDLGHRLTRKLGNRSVVFDLSSPAGGRWQIGGNSQPAATVRMDALEFCILASGRATAQQVLERSSATIDGDDELAQSALENAVVPF